MAKKGIPMDYVKETCKLGKLHDCCRYLVCGVDGFACEKFGEFKDLLDKRVKDETIVARGDNCEGWNIVKDRGRTICIHGSTEPLFCKECREEK